METVMSAMVLVSFISELVLSAMGTIVPVIKFGGRGAEIGDFDGKMTKAIN
jgi:hypothetical protein